MKDPKYDISEGRKTLYYLGMALMAVGFLLFISVFFTMWSNPFGGPSSMGAAPIGFVLIILGSILRGIGGS